MKTKLVILDFDGPVNDLSKAKEKAIRKLFDKLKVNYSEEVVWELINYIDQIYESKKIFEYEKIITLGLEKIAERKILTINSETIEEFSKSFNNELKKNLTFDHQFINFFKSLVNNNENLKICIYSSQKEDIIRGLLEYEKIEINLFSKIYGRDSFQEPKPSIANLKSICNDFNILTSEAVLIGDNVSIDLAPAHYLGIETILYTKNTDHLVKSAEGLESIFK
jgi:HAD superfamily hydrolase (TIGR01549 family)